MVNKKAEKIIVDGEEIEIYTSLNDEEIEDNKDLFLKEELLEDTINIDHIIKKINNGGNYE